MQPDGRIVVAGATRVGLQDDFGIVRYLPDGRLDTGFGTQGRVSVPIFTDAQVGPVTFIGHNDRPYRVLIQPDGKIVVGGRASSATTDSDIGLMRFGADGQPEASFGPADQGYVLRDLYGAWDEMADIVVLPSGRLALASRSVAPDGSFRFTLAVFDADGGFEQQVTTPIGTGAGNDYSHALAQQADGKLLLAGAVRSPTAVSDFAVVRHLPDHTLDASFGSSGVVTVDFLGGADSAATVLVQPDGKILLVGVALNGTRNGLGMVRVMP